MGNLHIGYVVQDFPPEIGAGPARVTEMAHRWQALGALSPFGTDSIRMHNGESDPAQGWYCPEFGKAIPQSVIALRVDGNRGQPFGYTIRVESRPA